MVEELQSLVNKSTVQGHRDGNRAGEIQTEKYRDML